MSKESENFVSLKVAAEKKIHGDGVSKATYFSVKPHLVEVRPGFNRPIVRENIEQFKTAIRNGATIPPIYVTVEEGRIILVDGEHRILAVRELIAEGMDIASMSAIQFRGNDADQIAHLLTSAQGQAILPLDAGIQYLKLIRLGWTVQQIAARIGKSDTHVNSCLALAESNTDVHEHVRNGEVSGSTAAKIVKEHGSKAGAVIKEKLASAKEAGKKAVVTPKSLRPSTATPRPPAPESGPVVQVAACDRYNAPAEPTKREIAIAEAVREQCGQCALERRVPNTQLAIEQIDIIAIIKGVAT